MTGNEQSLGAMDVRLLGKVAEKVIFCVDMIAACVA